MFPRCPARLHTPVLFLASFLPNLLRPAECAREAPSPSEVTTMYTRQKLRNTITLLLLVFSFVVQAQEKNVSAQLLQEGQELLKANKPAEAAVKFEAAARQGNSDAQNELGKLYMQGLGVAWDAEKARDLFQQSADGGNIRGMTNLGMMYKGYRGIVQDWDKAAQWLTKAAELGQPMAQCELAALYAYGFSVELDQKKAFEWYSKSAEQGFPRAQLEVAYYYLDDDGRGAVTKDTKLGTEWLQKAAKSGDPAVQADVAAVFLNEDDSMYDPSIAAVVLPDAARAGNWHAQYLLGKLYYEGLGVKRDDAIAFRLLNASAGQGRPEALALVAGMYLRGEGTEKNPQAAYICAEMADDGGWPFAVLEREEAAKLMTPEQLEQAKSVVAQRKAANAQRRAEWDKLNPKKTEDR